MQGLSLIHIFAALDVGSEPMRSRGALHGFSKVLLIGIVGQDARNELGHNRNQRKAVSYTHLVPSKLNNHCLHFFVDSQSLKRIVVKPSKMCIRDRPGCFRLHCRRGFRRLRCRFFLRLLGGCVRLCILCFLFQKRPRGQFLFRVCLRLQHQFQIRFRFRLRILTQPQDVYKRQPQPECRPARSAASALHSYGAVYPP